MKMMMMGENQDEDDVNYNGDNDDNIPQPGWVDSPRTTSSLDNRMLKLTRMTPKNM